MLSTERDTTDPGHLLEVLTEVRDELGTDPQYVHYLAVPPSTFGPITEGLVQHGLAEGARVRLKARLMPPAPPMLPGSYDFARAG